MPVVPGPLAPPQPSVIFGNPRRRGQEDDSAARTVHKIKRAPSGNANASLSAVGRSAAAALPPCCTPASPAFCMQPTCALLVFDGVCAAPHSSPGSVRARL